jgi:hypothetical protein
MSTMSVLEVLSQIDMVMTDSSDLRDWSNRDAVNFLKVRIGCESLECPVSGDLPAYALDFDHIDPMSKYVTKGGVREHLSDMVERYSWSTIALEIAKCRVLCRICHAHRTHLQRKV